MKTKLLDCSSSPTVLMTEGAPGVKWGEYIVASDMSLSPINPLACSTKEGAQEALGVSAEPCLTRLMLA